MYLHYLVQDSNQNGGTVSDKQYIYIYKIKENGVEAKDTPHLKSRVRLEVEAMANSMWRRRACRGRVATVSVLYSFTA